MIIVGIDFGDARTGIAVCDKYEMMARDDQMIKSTGFKKTAEAVAVRAAELGVELIVVGNPKNMDGSEGPRSQKCHEFAEYLREISGIAVAMCDERLTTVSAHKILSENNVRGKKRKDTVDSLSARLILEDYLTMRKNGVV
jgi:putative Holliday junction resolvase